MNEPIKIDILGQEWTIKEDEMLFNKDGQTDNSIKEIKLCNSLNNEPRENDLEDRNAYKRLVLRHEILHALCDECGLDADYGINTECNINWIAKLYPRMKALFKELEIED